MLIKPFWVLGIDRSVQNLAGTIQYGNYISLFNLSLLFHFLLDLGLSTYNNRQVTLNFSIIRKSIRYIIAIKSVLAVIYFGLTSLLAAYLSYRYNDIFMLSFFMLNQILISYIFFQRSNISAIHLFKTDAVFSVLDKLIMIVLSSLLIWGHFIEFQLKYFVYTQTIAYAISAIIISIVVYSKSKPKETSVYKSETKGLIKNSLPYAFMVLLMTIYMRLDILLLTHLLPNGEMYAGIYAQSYRILEAASMFSILFAHWLLPIFTRLLSDSKNLNSIINLSFFVLLIFSTIITFGVFFYHQEIMHRLYQNQTNESAQILSLLIFSFIPISINYIFGTLLTAGGKMKILLLVSFFGVLISIASNIILIRRLQGLGTALAANILYYTIAFFQIYFSIKTFHIKLNTKKVKRYFIFLLLIIFLGIILKSSPLVWIINFCIFVMLGILLAMALNIFSIKNIVLLIKEK